MIASVEESVVEVIDAEMYTLGGEVTRRPVDEVMGELEAAEEAADAAAREARRGSARAAARPNSMPVSMSGWES